MHNPSKAMTYEKLHSFQNWDLKKKKIVLYVLSISIYKKNDIQLFL